MGQTDRESYRTNESIAHQFLHSCLGRLVILGVILGALLLVAALTVPDDEVMTVEMEDNIRQCIATNDSIKTDGIDNAINNVGYVFTHTDVDDAESMEQFLKYNTMEIQRHRFYSKAVLHNNLRPEGIGIGIGIFGMVVPTLSYNDFLLRTGPMHKGYDQEIIQRMPAKESNSFESNTELGY
jgi:hypothetical protein